MTIHLDLEERRDRLPVDVTCFSVEMLAEEASRSLVAETAGYHLRRKCRRVRIPLTTQNTNVIRMHSRSFRKARSKRCNVRPVLPMAVTLPHRSLEWLTAGTLMARRLG